MMLLTTAINRSNLHLTSFTSYKKIFSNKFPIIWIINIDFVKSNNSNFDKNTRITENNIRSIFRDYNITWIFIHNKDGWFNRAVRTVLQKSIPYLEKVYFVLYLEDDWYYDGPYLDKIVSIKERDYFSVINLSNRSLGKTCIHRKKIKRVISNHPTIWSVKIFKYVIQTFNKNKDVDKDPELILEQNFLPIFEQSQNINDIRFRVLNYTKDIGRDWMQDANVVKNNKNMTGKNGKTYL